MDFFSSNFVQTFDKNIGVGCLTCHCDTYGSYHYRSANSFTKFLQTSDVTLAFSK